MNNEQTQVDLRRASRRLIILIGAPSGAGKSVLSRTIIAGKVPLFAELSSVASGEAPVRYDLKVLPECPPRDKVLIIECSTHKFANLTRTDQWQRLIGLVHESEMVIHVNLKVPRRTVIRQYFLRIFTRPKRMPVLYRILQLSKYRNTLIYMLTRQLSRADAAWYRFGRKLAEDLPERVAIVHALRIGSDYNLLLERSPDRS